jgi:hypothetical protein
MTVDEQVPIWDAINEYAHSWEGNPSKISERRMDAVVAVNRAIEKLIAARLAEWEQAAQQGHPSPCNLGPLCPYCEIDRLNASLAMCAEREGRVREALEKIHELTVMQSSSACRDIHAVADAALTGSSPCPHAAEVERVKKENEGLRGDVAELEGTNRRLGEELRSVAATSCRRLVALDWADHVFYVVGDLRKDIQATHEQWCKRMLAWRTELSRRAGEGGKG